jgi:site-specific DNA recombinase
MELLDQYQRLEIALKLGRGRNQKAQQGGYAGGRATFRYQAKKGQKRITVDEKQAQIVRRIFELKEQHTAWSLTKIAEAMNEEGFTTGQGSLFTKVQIKRILDKRDFYSGTYRYGDIEAIGLHEAIL